MKRAAQRSTPSKSRAPEPEPGPGPRDVARPESSEPPLISFVSDFGRSDWFVGVVHGVLLEICPRARIVDLTHEILPLLWSVDWVIARGRSLTNVLIDMLASLLIPTGST